MTPAAPFPGELPAEVRAAHAELSPHNLAFVEYARRHPEALAPSTSRVLEGGREYGLGFSFQPWPTLVSRDIAAEMERVSLGLHRLLVEVPDRLFAGDERRIASWYGIPGPDVATALRGRRVNPCRLFGRGDFTRTAGGWRCLEFNFSSTLGGWQYPILEPVYRGMAPLREFLAECGLEVRCSGSLRMLFGRMIEDVLRVPGLAPAGEVRLALVSDAVPALAPNLKRALEGEYGDALRAAPGARDGGLLFCLPGDLTATAEGVFVAAPRRRLHALVLSSFDWRLPRDLWGAFEARAVLVYNNPYQRILRHKANLAALSELGEPSAGLSAEERELVRRHVPWTRRLLPGPTRYRGRDATLPELLLAEPAAFVLKPGEGHSGEGVLVGREMETAAWREAVARALVGGGWIVQEYIQSRPYLYPWRGEGCAVQNLVWGLFTAGDGYAGGFVRMLPRQQSAVVNSARGAWEGPIFEIVREGGP